jgi:flagellar biosynthesis protein FlhA
MVTKASSENSLGSDLAGQVFSQPKALAITAGVCGVLMFIPGIPKLPFALAAICGMGLWYVLKQQTQVRAVTAETTVQAPKTPDTMTDLLVVDPIEVELGYGLIPLADPKQGGDMLDRITAVRRQSALDMGLLIPAIRVRDNMQLKPNTYRIKLRGVEIARGEVFPGQLLAMNPGTATAQLRGVETTEPAFGLPAIWISEVQQSEAEMEGFTVVDPLTVMITHLTEILRRHAAEILTRQDTQALIETVKEQSPAVVAELIPELLALGDVQKVLQNLLSERVCIRDMATILEALADAAPIVKDPDMLTEHVRQALSRQITAQYQSPDAVVHVFTLDPLVEQRIAEGIRQTEVGCQLILEPDTAQHILSQTREQVERMAAIGYVPVCLCSPRTRMHFRRLAERMVPSLAVLSYNELASGAGLETIGMVSLVDETVEDQSKQYA